MALCAKVSTNDEVFVVTRLFRDGTPLHYAFVGEEITKKHKDLLGKISTTLPNATEEKRLEKIFSKKTIKLFKTILSNDEEINFIPDKIWLDDTIYQIKIKLFSYLSSLNQRKFLLPQNQQLWVMMDRDGRKKDIILGIEFIKQIEKADGTKTLSYPMSYPPALDTDKVEVDNEFLTANGERTSDVQAINEESDILYDFLTKRGRFEEVNRIFLYMLSDEIQWYRQKFKKDDISKKVWNGYFLKQWPFADTDIGLNQVVRMYREVNLSVKATEKVIAAVKEEDIIPDPKLGPCYAWQLIMWSRLLVRKDTRPFRMDMAYSFLRSLLSDNIPFIYYTSDKDKRPFVSVYEPALDTGIITGNRLREWVFTKGASGKYVPKEKKNIVIKMFLYKGDTGTKFLTLTLLSNGDVSINLTFEESKRANITDIEQAIQKVTDLITLLNTEFLEKQGSPTFPVPEFRVEDNEFVMDERTHIQYINVITTFSYKKEISFKKLLDFSRQYKPFSEPSVLTQESDDMSELSLKYRRISSSSDLSAIFEFIDKERLSGTAPEATVEAIVRRFGKTKQEANETYRQYRVMKEDPQSARRLIKQSGVTMKFTHAEKYQERVKNKTIYNYKIFISGLSSLFILRNCYQFLQHFINSFYHPKLAPEKKATQILMEKGIEFDFGYTGDNIADVDEVGDVEAREPVSEEEELALSNFDIGAINLNNNNKPKRDSDAIFSSTGTVDIRDESKADPTVRLRCATDQNKIVDKGTCKNICDDLRFKLRRLQQFEPRIFHFPHLRGKNQPYSRQCDDLRRPIVMAYDPSTNPKIDKDSFTYAIKYRSSAETPFYYYICPQAWCPICEMPIALAKLKTRKTIRTKRGECEFGICPNGNHQVYINVKGKEYTYPGFIDPGGNPEGLCMPCCFKTFTKNTATYRRCVKDDPSSGVMTNGDENVDEGWKYINRQDKIPLQEGRFGLLPAEVEAFLGQTGCKNGTIKQGFDCLVRKGVRPSPDRSFVYAITDLVSGISGSRITEDEMRKRLIAKITPQLFTSLNSGRVKRIFVTIERFKEYLGSSEKPLPDTYLWDLVSRPGVFTEEGFNLVIFTPHSIYCPFGQNPWELYSLSKPTALIIKFGNTYEPIYRIHNPDGQPRIIVLHSTVNPMISKVVEFARKGCQSYNEIDWDKAGKTDRKKELNLLETLAELEKDSKNIPKIAAQYTDFYSKTCALVFEGGGYLPVKPSRVRTDIPFLTADQSEEFKPLPLKQTLTFLSKFQGKTDIPVIPTHLIMHGRRKSKVVALLLETGRAVPIQEIEISAAQKGSRLIESEMLYYPETNQLIAKWSPEHMTPEIKERIRTINEYRYKNEAFERYKFEIGRYLQEPRQKKIKDELIKLLEDPNKNLSKVKTIVRRLDGEISSTPVEGAKRMQDLLSKSNTLYRTPLLRKPCFKHSKQNCGNDPHCVTVGTKCKLVTLPNTDFPERILDLLRRYPIQRGEILDGRVPITDPLQSLKQPEAEEVLLSGNKIDMQFAKLIAKEKGTIFLETFPDIDIAQPSFEGVDKQSYLIVSPEREAEAQAYSLASVSQHWSSQLGPWFRLVSPLKSCESLYFCFAQLAIVIAKKQKELAEIEKEEEADAKETDKNNVFDEEESLILPDVDTITLANIKEVYAHFLLQVPPEKVREVATTELRLPDKEEIQRMVDVSDFYNKFQDEETVDSVDDLVERIMRGPPAHYPSLFDMIWLGVMLDIKIILLRKSISELIGKGNISRDLYGVFFYEPTSTEDDCIRFYLLQKSGIALVASADSTVRKLLPS